MRLILDTNVLIAAFVSRGVCHSLLEHAQQAHTLISSPVLLAEFEDKLAHKFKVPSDRVARAGALIRNASELIEPSALVPGVCRDPDNDWVLATAVQGNCRCIVTGDKDLLVLDAYRGVQILMPGAFWAFEAGA